MQVICYNAEILSANGPIMISLDLPKFSDAGMATGIGVSDGKDLQFLVRLENRI